MAIDTALLKMELARIERELEALKARIEKFERKDGPDEMPFTKMCGAWKGANFTEEEIDAAKIRVKDFPE